MLRGLRHRAMVVGITSDVLYPYELQTELARHMPNAQLYAIDSPHGGAQGPGVLPGRSGAQDSRLRASGLRRLGLRAEGYELWALGLGCRVSGFGFQISDFGLWVMGYGLWVMGYGLWVMGLGFLILVFGLRFWVLGFGFWVLGFGL